MQFLLSQSSVTSDLFELVDNMTAKLYNASAPINHFCCKIKARLQVGIQSFAGKNFIDKSLERINIVLTNEIQLRDIQDLPLNTFPSDEYEDTSKFISPILWDYRYLNRWCVKYSDARVLISNNEKIIVDPKSGVPLPISYIDQDSKENVDTLKDEFVSFIVLDDLSMNDRDFNWKLIKSLIIEGKWAKQGINHNLIIPIFLNKNSIDLNLEQFSGIIQNSEILLGHAAQQAMSMILMNSFWVNS